MHLLVDSTSNFILAMDFADPTIYTIFAMSNFYISTMDFTPEQKDKAKKHLLSVKCPVCGSDIIKYTGEATQIIAFKRNSDDADSSNVSWINAFCGVCQSCGYIMQFSVSHVIK